MMPRPFRSSLCALAGLGALLPAQHVRDLDASRITRVTYDTTRGRFVALSWDRTVVLHNDRWRPTTVEPSLETFERLVFDSGAGALLGIAFPNTPSPTTMRLFRLADDRWGQVITAHAPPWRGNYALAFDRSRSEVLLFGGQTGLFTFVNDTWVFDGTDWRPRAPNTSPGPRASAPLVCDTARSRMVLFGGHVFTSLPYNTPFNDTWEWDGTDWHLVPVPTPPPTGQEALMTYDEARQRAVMFHAAATTPPQYSSQVYEYDGTNWQPAGIPGGPWARFFATFVYDPARQTSVLLGGDLVGGTLPGDSWEWNGAGWTQHPARPSACARPGELLLDPQRRVPIQVDLDPLAGPTMSAFDGVTWQPVATPCPPGRFEPATCVGPTYSYVHGGDTYQGRINDTWGYDGSTWQLLSTSGPATYASGIAYDYAAADVVLFGGRYGANATIADTWVLHGSTWQQRQPMTVPPPRDYPLMAYDFARGRVVMHGGRDQNGQRRSDTWQWDGFDWSPVPSSATPVGERLAFDTQRLRLVLLAGPPAFSTEVWTLEPGGWQLASTVAGFLPSPFEESFTAVGFPYPFGLLFKNEFNLYSVSITEAATDEYGTACTNPAPRVASSGWPRLASPDLRVDVHDAPPVSLIALLAATQAANLPVQGCAVLVDPSGALAVAPTNAAGFASVPMPLPPWPALLGLDLFLQAACLDPTAPAGFSTSRGRRLTLGT